MIHPSGARLAAPRTPSTNAWVKTERRAAGSAYEADPTDVAWTTATPSMGGCASTVTAWTNSALSRRAVPDEVDPLGVESTSRMSCFIPEPRSAAGCRRRSRSTCSARSDAPPRVIASFGSRYALPSALNPWPVKATRSMALPSSGIAVSSSWKARSTLLRVGTIASGPEPSTRRMFAGGNPAWVISAPWSSSASRLGPGEDSEASSYLSTATMSA